MATCPRCVASPEGCRRCGERLCMEHLPLSMTCVACDLAYYDSRDRIHPGAWWLAGFSAVWFAFAFAMHCGDFPTRVAGGFRSFTTGVPAIDFTIMSAFLSVFAGRAVLGIRRAIHRRAFDRGRDDALPPMRLVERASSGRRAGP